jgi:hypothetical protein
MVRVPLLISHDRYVKIPLRKDHEMKIDIRTDECCYIEFKDWIIYLDDSTGEMIMEKWEKKDEEKKTNL